MAHCVFTFRYVVHFVFRKQTGDIRWGGGTGKTGEFDMNGRMVLGNEREQNGVCFTNEGPPFGKYLAALKTKPRNAPLADMGGSEKAVHSTRDPTPCLHDTTTSGVTGAGNETTETKAGTGKGTEAAIRIAGAAAPAAQDGLAQTRDDQACVISINLYFLTTV
jgi:hypothetical protein